MKIAVITGASSGLGREYALEIEKEFPEIEQFWLIARRKERLEELSKELKKPCYILPLDLGVDESYEIYKRALETEKPEVMILVNCSGFGKLGNFDESSCTVQNGMVDVNVKGATAMTSVTLPCMPKNSFILQISSIAAFMPIPRLAVYAATKSYIYSFTRALRYELKPRKINVTAVCPGPMNTEFLDVANISGNSKLFASIPTCKPNHVVKGSLRAAQKGRCVYTDKFIYKALRVLTKIIPQSWITKASKA